MMRARSALVIGLLVDVLACKRAMTTNVDASLPPDASAVDASASTLAPEAGTPCVRTALQPDTCVEAGVFPLDRDASLRWFEAHGLRGAADLATASKAPINRCREASFGPTRESLLLCEEVDVTHVDAKLGLDGPAQTRTALRVATVRGSRLVTFVRVPVSLGSSELDELFRANVVLDEKAPTLEVVASTEDCERAPSRLEAYWEKHIAEMKRVVPDAKTRSELTRAMTSERKAGAPRIAEICAARGRYVLVGERLVRQPR